MPQFTLVVQSSPVAGKESEYNRWYTEQHLPDALDMTNLTMNTYRAITPLKHA